MTPTNRIIHLPEAYSRVLLDASRALESLLGAPFAPDTDIVQDRSKVIAGTALLCRAIARTLCVEPEATLLSVVVPSLEGILDD